MLDITKFVVEVANQRYPGYSFVFFYGSTSRHEDSAVSDIDISVVYEKNIRPFRDVFSVQNRVVDAFVYDMETIHFELMMAKEKGSTVILDIVQSAIHLPEPTPFSLYLLDMARKLSPLPIEFDKNRLRLFLTSLVSDLDRAIDPNVSNSLCIDLYRLLSEVMLLKHGINGMLRKYASIALKRVAPEFCTLLNFAIQEYFTSGKTEALRKMASEFLEEIGGPMTHGYRGVTSENRLAVPEEFKKINSKSL